MSDQQRPSDHEHDPAEAEYEKARGEKSGPDLPAMDFATFVLSLSHSVLFHLGDAPDLATGKSVIDIPMARQTIDLLGLLQEKTRGNLSGPEEALLTQALYDLRLRFVEVARAK